MIVMVSTGFWQVVTSKQVRQERQQLVQQFTQHWTHDGDSSIVSACSFASPVVDVDIGVVVVNSLLVLTTSSIFSGDFASPVVDVDISFDCEVIRLMEMNIIYLFPKPHNYSLKKF